MKGKMTFTSKGVVYQIGGVEVTKKEFDAAFPVKPLGKPPMLGGNTSICWPQQSDAMAVHPSQIKAVMERNKKHGVHVDYNPADGRPILMDRGQRRDLMRIERFHDNQGGFGDDTGVGSQDHQPTEEVKIMEGL